MDAIAATASIGQLVQYGGAVTLTLIRLIKDISQGPLIYKNEECNVRLLLRLVYRISTDTDCRTQDDEFVELFRRVERIAQNILQLLGHTSSFVFRVISAVTRHRSISEAFQALCATRELLHLYVTTSLSQDVKAHLKAVEHDMGKDNYTTQQGGSSGQNNAPEPNASAGSSFEQAQPEERSNFSGNVVGLGGFGDFGHDMSPTPNNNPEAVRNRIPMTVNNNRLGERSYFKAGSVDRDGLNKTYEIHKQIQATSQQSSPPGQAPPQNHYHYLGEPTNTVPSASWPSRATTTTCE
ncbi:uncharacterized protein PG998_003125 [Apiospora kogelbergensis]|uniref:uncharacterized protein n=1 Tax=Apiospora kogelbergensis TaxID=1337665 RepID=UPI00312FC272